MTIYSMPIGDLTQRIAKKQAQLKNEKAGPTAPATNGTRKRKVQFTEPAAAANSPPPTENGETPNERRNRLARERRALQKQAKLDAEAGVTLATGKAQPPVKDLAQPTFKTPSKKDAVPATMLTASTTNVTSEEEPSPPLPALPAKTTTTTTAAVNDDEEEEETPRKSRWPVPPKTSRRKNPGTHDDTEPPTWYTRLLTEVIKTKMDEVGEKASKKVIKETTEEIAKDRWASPEERERVRGNQDKLYNQMFGRVF